MPQYRVKCPNPQCSFHGLVQGVTLGGYKKKHFAELHKKKNQGGDGSERVQLRCPKCARRWRMRANQLRPV